MRTQQEIVDRIEVRKEHDFLGFEVGEYVNFLDYDHAQPYLKVGVTPDQWAKVRSSCADIKNIMADYMEFAWDKAKNCRGISAVRSIMHYQAWLWIEGSTEAMNLIDDIADYSAYGKPELRKICRFLGIDADKYGDGIRVNCEGELPNAKLYL